MRKLPTPTAEQLANRLEWAEALLSGDYTPGTGQLCYTTNDEVDKWCCLGVAADTCIAGHWVNLPRTFGRYTWGLQLVRQQHPDETMIHEIVFTATFGMTWEDQRALATANDKGTSFLAIAKWLKKGAIPDRFYH